MKRVLLLSLCVLVLFGFVGCREKGSVPFENDISEEIIDNSTESQISAEELEKTEITDKSVIDDEKEYMKLYFNDTEVPVIWENNQTVVFYCKEIANFKFDNSVKTKRFNGTLKIADILVRGRLPRP